MDCRETQTLLTGFHDGELPAADHARVEEHLRGCKECGALLADLARADHAAGVPDPGPAYWDRFNARVMDRVRREADGPKVAVLRPNHGWMRQQLRYLVPAAAAAALVVVVVHYGGMTPIVPTTVRDGQVPVQAGTPPGVSTMAKDGQVSGQAGTPPDSKPRPAKDGQVPGQAGTPRTLLPRPTVPPAVSEPAPADPAGQRMAKAGPGSRSQGWPSAEAGRDAPDSAASPPAAMSAPSPPPMTYRGAPGGHGWPSAGAGRDAPDSVAPADGIPSEMQTRQKKMAEAGAIKAEHHAAGKAKSASGTSLAKEPSPDGQGRPSAGAGRDAPDPIAPADGQGRPSAGAGRDAPDSVAPAGSPCGLARTLAAGERFREAEVAQRACLAGDLSEPSREKGLVFLAEMLDRQARFVEADAVISEIQRRFPESLQLDLYLRRRPMVQKRQE